MLGTTSRVAKIFGMSVGKGSSVIPIIIRDGDWQYQWFFYLCPLQKSWRNNFHYSRKNNNFPENNKKYYPDKLVK